MARASCGQASLATWTRSTTAGSPVLIVEVGGQRLLRFEDVVLAVPPDVHVYLARETGGKWDEATNLYLGAPEGDERLL